MGGLLADGISASRGGRAVLDRVSLALRPGEMVGLVGPNGAGKTTLLDILAGIAPAEVGKVTLDGSPLVSLPGPERARKLSYLEQAAASHWPLRVERLVTLGRLPYAGPWGRLAEDDAAAVARALDRCGVAHLRDRTATTLSGGERARVMLARALATEPAYLLADEPAAGLDPRHQLSVLGLLAGLAAGGMGVLVVLHDLSLALRFCTRLCLLSGDGRVAADGPPGALLAGGHLERAFGIELHRGHRDGQHYALPWRVAGGEGCRG